MEYQLFFFIYFFTKVHVLVLHFVKTINSNINVQIKLKENIFMLYVLQCSTISLALSRNV